MTGIRSSARIPVDRRMKRKLEWEDTRRPAWVMWLSVACVVSLVVLLIALSNSDRMSRPTAVNGDALGPETGESIDAYRHRAAATLADATGDAARWALVTPEHPVGVPGLTALFAPSVEDSDLRVSTLLTGQSQWPLPEPSVGHRREDVFTAAWNTIARTAGVADSDPSLLTGGIVVHATPAQLTALATVPGVLAVEALPPDAVYGRFAMRPLDTGVPAPVSPEEPAA